ncbi:unnamed protein product [Pseudo-nitzschia multistriata]|uniref:Uncharacterized protein n=1 Tax=Pseudo-nitzschia multistriata TaxID=183589 RepID=A0A448YU92_9STRA|nr:unnamed protein product [Pseudo-nitzschia multistriata]
MMDNAVEARDQKRTIDPILNLPVNSLATSLCFVCPAKINAPATKIEPDIETSGNTSYPDEKSAYFCEDDDSESDSDSDDNELLFRSSSISITKTDSNTSIRGGRHLHRVLNDRFLASCHQDGEALLWDLNRQKNVARIAAPRGGSGLCVRRTDDPSQIMVQTRDPKGIVSLHSIERCRPIVGSHGIGSDSDTTSNHVRQYETHSQTFCRAAPCYGNKHLLALPSDDESTVTVVDNRSNSSVATYSVPGHGMLTSLGLAVTDHERGYASHNPILACGMENGTAVFFDITSGSAKPVASESSFSLGKDPILTLDLLPSFSRSIVATHENCPPSFPITSSSNALLVAAGMAGDAEEVSELSEDEAGRAVLFKAFCRGDSTSSPAWTFKQRKRFSTCRVDRDGFNGKPGVSSCKFRPGDGRLLAIGGWDRRIRLFERSTGKPMAILKGNVGSVADLDWAPDSMKSGLLASACRGEKSISIWQCYAKR